MLFSTVPLEDLAGLVGTQFRLILFNPPAFFFVRDADLSTPAARGVYAGDARRALEINQSPLFQFFQKVVLPLLALGGEVICAWPGLERRVVELDPAPEKRGRAAHPADLLETWLDITVDCADNDADRFYCHTAVINLDYGLGDTFWRNLDYALQDPRCYSTLVKPSNWRYGSRPTFRFGVLRLRRSQSITSRFEVVCAEGGSGD
jgi:hypothetical protein